MRWIKGLLLLIPGLIFLFILEPILRHVFRVKTQGMAIAIGILWTSYAFYAALAISYLIYYIVNYA